MHGVWCQLSTVSSFQTQVTQDGKHMGTMDKFTPQTNEYRIQVEYPGTVKSLAEEESLNIPLGTSDWGEIQTSMLMTKHPATFARSDPFCSLTPGHWSIRKKATHTFNKSSGGLYDDLIHKDQVFFVTASGDLHAFRIQPYIEKVKPPMVGFSEPADLNITQLQLQWTITNLTGMIYKATFRHIYQATIAYNEETNTLYWVSNVISAFDSLTSSAMYFNADLYTDYQEMTYCDIKKNILMIAVKNKGIDLYDVSKKTELKYLGTLDKGSFGNGPLPEITDFEMQTQQVEIFNVNDPQFPDLTRLKENPTKNSLFDMGFTIEQRNKFIQEDDQTAQVLLIAAKDGIYIYDMTYLILKKEFTQTRVYIHKISIPDCIKIARFHYSFYALQKNSTGSFIHEIFVHSKDFSGFNDPVRMESELYTVNKVFKSTTEINNIYVDENYLYCMGPESNFIAERNIQSMFLSATVKPPVRFASEAVLTVSKTIINGKPYLITITDDTIAQYEITTVEQYITCPELSQINSQAFGEYRFDVNVTLRNCDDKIRLFNRDPSEILKKSKSVCVLRKSLIVNYDSTTFMLKKSNTGYGFLFFVVMVVTLLLSLIACARRTVFLNTEYEKVRKEMESFRVQVALPANDESTLGLEQKTGKELSEFGEKKKIQKRIRSGENEEASNQKTDENDADKSVDISQGI